MVLFNPYRGAAPPSLPIRKRFYWGFIYWSAPAEQPFGILVAHIDAAVAHLHPEIVMPECPVKGDTGVDKKGCPWNSGKGIAIAIISIWIASYPAHVFGWHFRKDMESSRRGGGWDAIRRGQASWNPSGDAG